MLKSIIALACFTVAALVAVAQPKHAENMDIEAKAVMAVISEMTSALQNGNVDQVMSTYEKGAVIVFEPGAPMQDETSARAIFGELAALSPKVDYPSGDEVLIAGDIAIHIAPWKMNGETADGEKITQGGLSVAVLRRQADGTWRIVIDNPYSDRLLND